MISCKFWSVLHSTGFPIHLLFSFSSHLKIYKNCKPYIYIYTQITHATNKIVLKLFKLNSKRFEGRIKGNCKARRKIITTPLTQCKDNGAVSELIIELLPSPGHRKAGLWYSLLIYMGLKPWEMLKNCRVVWNVFVCFNGSEHVSISFCCVRNHLSS